MDASVREYVRSWMFYSMDVFVHGCVRLVRRSSSSELTEMVIDYVAICSIASSMLAVRGNMTELCCTHFQILR